MFGATLLGGGEGILTNNDTAKRDGLIQHSLSYSRKALHGEPMHQSMARPEMQDLVCPVSSTREGKDNQSTVHVRFCELRLPFRGQGRGSADEVREHMGQKKSPSAPWTRLGQ